MIRFAVADVVPDLGTACMVIFASTSLHCTVFSCTPSRVVSPLITDAVLYVNDLKNRFFHFQFFCIYLYVSVWLTWSYVI
jgi:hypothetical protein